MPFVLIKGHFVPKAGRPDGDSVRFRANNLRLWRKLKGRPVKIGEGPKTKGTVQLRFEGIDAIEKDAIKPLSTKATNNMLKLIDFSTNNPEPRGYVLARMTDDPAGRPICFGFAGNTPKGDGTEVFLDRQMIRRSVNYKQMKAGYAYPLYYNTLFTALREEFNQALKLAKKNKLGYWPTDATTRGVTIRKHATLKNVPPIWPKLWRRLDTYLRKNRSLAGFVDWLEESNERVDILSLMEERGLHDIVKVKGNKVRMTESPENLRVVAKAGRRHR